MFGQQSLFGSPGANSRRGTGLRFRVSAGGVRQSTTVNLALAVARARSAAVEGRRVVVVASDGTAAVVELRLNGAGFVVIAHGPGSWPDQCRRLLDEHG